MNKCYVVLRWVNLNFSCYQIPCDFESMGQWFILSDERTNKTLCSTSTEDNFGIFKTSDIVFSRGVE